MQRYRDSFSEVFGAVSFGASDGLAVNVPLARDFDLGDVES